MSLQDNTKRGAADITALLFVFIASALPFLAALRFGIVNCDDYDYVRYVIEGKSIFGLEQAIFMPVTWLTYRLDFIISALTGSDTYHIAHAQSILWHSANAVLLFCIFTKLFRAVSPFIIAIATLLWSAHPLRVESVVWIASRKDVVSMFFMLVAWLFWLRKERITIITVLISSLFMILGCCAKPSIIVFPVLVFFGDLILCGSTKPPLSRQNMVRFLAYIPFIIISVAAALMAFIAQLTGGAMDAQKAVPLWWRVCNAISSIGVYTVNTICPIDLAPQCLARWPKMPCGFVRGVIITLALVAFSGFLVKNYSRKITREMAAGLLIFLISLVPFLGIVGFGVHAFADRFTYIPAIGLSLVFLAAGAELGKKIFGLIGTVLLIPLSHSSHAQTLFWENDGKLWSRTIQVDGSANFEAYVNLGFWHFEYAHDIDSAINCFAAAYNANPERSGRILQYWLLALCEKGDRDAARQVYYDLAAWNCRQVESARRRGEAVGATLGFLIGRVIFLKDDPVLGAQVIKESEDIWRHFGDNIHVKYMRYLLGKAPATEVVTSDTLDYVQYRFLRGKPL